MLMFVQETVIKMLINVPVSIFIHQVMMHLQESVLCKLIKSKEMGKMLLTVT